MDGVGGREGEETSRRGYGNLARPQGWRAVGAVGGKNGLLGPWVGKRAAGAVGWGNRPLGPWGIELGDKLQGLEGRKGRNASRGGCLMSPEMGVDRGERKTSRKGYGAAWARDRAAGANGQADRGHGQRGRLLPGRRELIGGVLRNELQDREDLKVVLCETTVTG
jgi:hypothetical protein